TCLFALHMSAFDPKRTSVTLRPTPSRAPAWIATITCLSLGGDNEAARFRHASRWCCSLAVFGACTATDEAGYRIHECPFARRYWACVAGVSQRSGRSRLFRRPERDHRIPLGARRLQPATCARCRICPASRECTRDNWRRAFGPGSEASYLYDPDRVCS